MSETPAYSPTELFRITQEYVDDRYSAVEAQLGMTMLLAAADYERRMIDETDGMTDEELATYYTDRTPDTDSPAAQVEDEKEAFDYDRLRQIGLIGDRVLKRVEPGLLEIGTWSTGEPMGRLRKNQVIVTAVVTDDNVRFTRQETAFGETVTEDAGADEIALIYEFAKKLDDLHNQAEPTE